MILLRVQPAGDADGLLRLRQAPQRANPRAPFRLGPEAFGVNTVGDYPDLRCGESVGRAERLARLGVGDDQVGTRGERALQPEGPPHQPVPVAGIDLAVANAPHHSRGRHNHLHEQGEQVAHADVPLNHSRAHPQHFAHQAHQHARQIPAPPLAQTDVAHTRQAGDLRGELAAGIERHYRRPEACRIEASHQFEQLPLRAAKIQLAHQKADANGRLRLP